MSGRSRVGYAVRALFFRLLTLRGQHAIHSLPVWAPLSTAEEKLLILRRLADSMDLLRIHAPRRHARVLRSLRGILVFGTDSQRASYDTEQRVCRLSESLLLAPSTIVASISATVVHEATHGWLFDLGIGYAEPVRHRVEQICIRAALQVARKLPGGEEEIDRCQRLLMLEADAYSDESYVLLAGEKLRELGCPEWIVRLVMWFKRKRAA